MEFAVAVCDGPPAQLFGYCGHGWAWTRIALSKSTPVVEMVIRNEADCGNGGFGGGGGGGGGGATAVDVNATRGAPGNTAAVAVTSCGPAVAPSVNLLAAEPSAPVTLCIEESEPSPRVIAQSIIIPAIALS